MDLGFRADVSARHLSFLETGRASPSREMVLRLAGALQVSRRAANSLLEAAGYAAHYSEVDLGSPEAAEARRVIEFILTRHEPFSALAFDRKGDIVAANAAHRRLVRALRGGSEPPEAVGGNVLRLLLHPAGLRDTIVNEEEVAAWLARFRRELERFDDPELRKLEDELARYGLSDDEGPAADPERSPPLMLRIHLRGGGLEVELLTVTTTLGTAIDVTLSELRIETYFPADHATEATLRRLAGEDAEGRRATVRWREAAS